MQQSGVVLLASLLRPKDKFWCSDILSYCTVSVLFFLVATLQCIMANLTPTFPWLKVQSGNLHDLTMGISVFTGKPSTYFQKEVQSRMRRKRECYFTSFSSHPPFLLQLHEILSALRPGLGLLGPENRQQFHFELWVHKEHRSLCEIIFGKQRLHRSQK